MFGMPKGDVEQSGMAMLFTELLRNAGIDPEKIKQDIEDFANGVKSGIASVDNRLKAMEEKQELILSLLQRAGDTVPAADLTLPLLEAEKLSTLAVQELKVNGRIEDH